MASWLSDKGARHIVLVSRHGCRTLMQKSMLKRLRQNGCAVHEICCDISKENEVRKMLLAIDVQAPQLKGIFHLAAVINSNNITQISRNELQQSLESKAYAAEYLHNNTLSKDLDIFMMMSSVVGVWGTPELAAYSAANNYLDALACHRRSKGLPGLAVQLGAVRGTGTLERNTKAATLLDLKGNLSLHISECLAALETLLLKEDLPPVVTIANMV